MIQWCAFVFEKDSGGDSGVIESDLERRKAPARHDAAVLLVGGGKGEERRQRARRDGLLTLGVSGLLRFLGAGAMQR